MSTLIVVASNVFCIRDQQQHREQQPPALFFGQNSEDEIIFIVFDPLLDVKSSKSGQNS